MIKFVGNYESIIPASWIPHMNQCTGEIRPNSRMVITPEVKETQEQWRQAGYVEGSAATWELFHDWDFTEQIDITKFDFCKGKKVQWWISKVVPGHCFPIHVDTVKEDLINPKRYWIALNDYKWGHVFLVEDTCLRDYKKGDAFEFANIPHGAANVGLENKYSLQMLVSDLE
jgi:hypothetical protein